MKIAIISDIHSNIHALEAVISDALRCGAQQFICLGDIVGYGAHPQACVDRVRELKIPTVQGNHDAWSASRVSMRESDISLTARFGIDYSRKKLTVDAKRWLKKIPLKLKTDELAVTHASFDAPNSWPYLTNLYFATRAFSKMPGMVGFYGHTHEAGLWLQSTMEWTDAPINRTIDLKRGERYLINPGSVGNPRTSIRESDNRAQYAIFNKDRMRITFCRVAYDVRGCMAAMSSAGFPEEMLARIELGY